MASDAKKMRGAGPVIFAQAKNNVGVGELAEMIVAACESGGEEAASSAADGEAGAGAASSRHSHGGHRHSHGH